MFEVRSEDSKCSLEGFVMKQNLISELVLFENLYCTTAGKRRKVRRNDFDFYALVFNLVLSYGECMKQAVQAGSHLRLCLLLVIKPRLPMKPSFHIFKKSSSLFTRQKKMYFLCNRRVFL